MSAKGGNVIQGNYIVENWRGIDVIFGSHGNLIGGTTITARNVISANRFEGISIIGGAADNLVQGNFVGTDSSGAVGQGNGGTGVAIEGAPNNLIGGETPGARNLISGNSGDGVHIDAGFPAAGFGNVVQGNYIGTDVSGTRRLPNQGGMGLDEAARDSLIGGTSTGAGNVVSGNDFWGIQINHTFGALPVSQKGLAVQGNFIGTDPTGTRGVPNAAGRQRYRSSRQHEKRSAFPLRCTQQCHRWHGGRRWQRNRQQR